MASLTNPASATGTINTTSRPLPYAFIAPTLILVTLGLAYPAIYGAWSTFFSDQVGRVSGEFIGLDNYRAVLRQPFFWNSLYRSVVFVFGTIAITQIMAIGLAVMLHRVTRRGRLLRGIVLIPYLVTGIAAAEFWRVFFHSNLGFPNMILGFIGLPAVQWLGHSTNSMVVIIIAAAWLIAPLAMLIIFAGLQAVDPNYLEAAAVDGASAWQRFRHITLYLISRQLVLSLLWISFNAFNTFAVIMRLTGGGPARATETLSLYMYQTAFGRLRIGEGLAIMMILLLINAGLSIGYLRFMDFESE